MNNFVFIAGASRSGTTLLMNLLDGHSQLALFPNNETRILQRWLIHRKYGDLDRFFFRDYLNASEVLLLTSDFAMKQYEDYMYNKYGNKDYLKGRNPDREKFIDLYLGYLRNNGLSLSNIYYAMFYAAFSINNIETGPKLFVEKRPLDNEICAPLLATEFPEAKFIHIIRDPRTRYLSAKMRRIRKNKGIYKVVDDFAGKDFATAHAEISMVSLELARLNKIILKERYHILRYEDLVDKTELEMKKITDFLGINFEPGLLEPSASGEKIAPSSSLAKISTFNVINTKKDRLAKYYQNTSQTERSILRLLNWEIANYYNYDIEKKESISITDFIRPLKHENPFKYIFNRIWMFKNFSAYSWSTKTHLYQALIDKFWQGETVSD
jgi:hypothetical protein